MSILVLTTEFRNLESAGARRRRPMILSPTATSTHRTLRRLGSTAIRVRIWCGPENSYWATRRRNGSFLVYRRLRQDVGLFWRTMRDEAGRLAKLDGFQGLTDDRLAARLVGRWQSGAPFNRVPAGDSPDLGSNPLANNNFLFDSDTQPVTLANGQTDPYERAKADPVGVACPWAAHIRKVNLRDSGSDIGGRIATYSRRLLRVGVAFGKSLEDRYGEQPDPQNGDRG